MRPRRITYQWWLILLAFLGMTGASRAQETVLRLAPSGGDYSALTGHVRLTVPPGAVSRTAVVLLRSAAPPPAVRLSVLAGQGQSYTVQTVPARIRFQKPVRLTVTFDGVAAANGLALYRHQGRVWYRVPATMLPPHGNTRVFVTDLNALVGGSVYALRGTVKSAPVRHTPKGGPAQFSVAPPDR